MVKFLLLGSKQDQISYMVSSIYVCAYGFASTLRGGCISSLEIVFQKFKLRGEKEKKRKPLSFIMEVYRIKFYYKQSINLSVLHCDGRMSFQDHHKDLVFPYTKHKKDHSGR